MKFTFKRKLHTHSSRESYFLSSQFRNIQSILIDYNLYFLARIQRTIQKDLNDLDNPNGLITHLDTEILECGVKWALGSITTSKASRSDGIPVELPQILKDDAFKVLHSITQYASKFGILSSGHRTGNGQFSFQFQRKAILKNVQTTMHCAHFPC